MRHVVFRSNPLDLLLWTDMGDAEKQTIHIPIDHRPWTNAVTLLIGRGRVAGPSTQVSIEYCSIKGILPQ